MENCIGCVSEFWWRPLADKISIFDTQQIIRRQKLTFHMVAKVRRRITATFSLHWSKTPFAIICRVTNNTHSHTMSLVIKMRSLHQKPFSLLEVSHFVNYYKYKMCCYLYYRCLGDNNNVCIYAYLLMSDVRFFSFSAMRITTTIQQNRTKRRRTRKEQ